MLSNSLTLAIKTGRRYWDAKIIIPHVKTKIEQIKKFLSKKMLSRIPIAFGDRSSQGIRPNRRNR